MSKNLKNLRTSHLEAPLVVFSGDDVDVVRDEVDSLEEQDTAHFLGADGRRRVERLEPRPGVAANDSLAFYAIPAGGDNIVEIFGAHVAFQWCWKMLRERCHNLRLAAV